MQQYLFINKFILARHVPGNHFAHHQYCIMQLLVKTANELAAGCLVWELTSTLRRKCLRISQKLNGLLGSQERGDWRMLKTICRKLVLEAGEKWLGIVMPGIDPEGG
jgi:hypothetical protein